MMIFAWTTFTILAAMALAGCVYWIVAWICLRGFARRSLPSAPAADSFLLVSVLKPVKGADEQAYYKLGGAGVVGNKNERRK